MEVEVEERWMVVYCMYVAGWLESNAIHLQLAGKLKSDPHKFCQNIEIYDGRNVEIQPPRVNNYHKQALMSNSFGRIFVRDGLISNWAKMNRLRVGECFSGFFVR